MKAQAALSRIQAVRVRQFVEQVDSRLLLLLPVAKAEPTAARTAEIGRLEKLRDLALQLLANEEAAA
ncbi:MAG: hypothetical protein JSR98_18140 [Proteobacteria bacterium]|nr:hypothetical protein [Pseudomonadota bacterium]